jgi:uncharacterized protein
MNDVDQNHSVSEGDEEPSKLVKIVLIALIGTFPLLAVGGYWFASKRSSGAASSAAGPVQVIDWQLLRELDLNTGKKSDKLTEADGRRVRLPGFMVPLEDNKAEVVEFLLVPNPQACIHVPPPPANQMVLVRMAENKVAQMSWGPVWVEGFFRVSTGASMYGNTSYQIMADGTEPYKADM